MSISRPSTRTTECSEMVYQPMHLITVYQLKSGFARAYACYYVVFIRVVGLIVSVESQGEGTV